MRPVELRDAGRTLRGVMLQEGRAASGGRAEVFTPGSVEWPSTGVGILLGHRERPEVRAMPSRESDGRIVVQAPATPAIREAVEGGRRFMSVEFHALEERVTKGGVREIQRALVPDVALVADPEYDTTVAEVRRRLGPSLRSSVPTGRGMDCACPEGDCDTIEFAPDAFKGITEALATTGTLDKVIGRAKLTPGRSGLGVAVDLLDTEASRDLVALISGGVSIFVRPLLDMEESDTTEERRAGGTLLVKRAAFSTVLVKPVAKGVNGMEPATLRESPRNRRGMMRVTGSMALGGDSRVSVEIPTPRRTWL